MFDPDHANIFMSFSHGTLLHCYGNVNMFATLKLICSPHVQCSGFVLALPHISHCLLPSSGHICPPQLDPSLPLRRITLNKNYMTVKLEGIWKINPHYI